MFVDWCLLAVKLGLVDKLPKLDTSVSSVHKASQTARLLDEWEQLSSSKIGKINDLFLETSFEVEWLNQRGFPLWVEPVAKTV